MITTEDRAPETAVVEAPPAPAPADTRSWLNQRISTEAAIMLGTVWYVLFAFANGVQPQSDAAVPAWSVVLHVILYGTIAAMIGGLAARRRWGAFAGLGAGSLFTALVVACPTTGHHPMAAWWFVQLVLAIGLVAASAYALRRA